MSWTQWPAPAAAVAQPPVVAAAPPLINPAPTVMPPGLPYNTDQWTQMQQQNWQQWAQWQQQYQQWHQQYGAEYQKSMNALAAQQNVVPNLGVPPPLPAEPQQPPLPQEEGPKPAPPLPGALAPTQQPPIPQYSTQPPPSNNFSAPPPNFTPGSTQQDWRAGNTTSLDQKRPLGLADESATKRQMINRQGWRNQNNTAPPPAQTWQGPNTPNPEELSEAEKKFDKQFAEWEAQFNKWKDQNSGHPDKQQYREYEKKWEQWRQQLLERREAMRKKRLGITGTTKAPSSQNFSVPPPSQGQGHFNIPAPSSQNVPPLQQSVLPNLAEQHPKTGLMPTPDVFNKPPPDMNDEPLQFKKNEEEAEAAEGTLGFLNTSKSEGIPGLDLVRDGESEQNHDEEQVPQKGPDLEAISKGINNILGDQKLMSMLSMVSQNQNMHQGANAKTNDVFPSQDQSNLSTDDSRNDPLIQSETVQNFDDQTRSSFTMQPSDSDFFRGAPPTNQFNRGGFSGISDNEPSFNKGPSNNRFENRPFVGPTDDFRRPPPNGRFGRGTNAPADDFDPSKGSLMNRNPGTFDRPPPGILDRDNFGQRGAGRPEVTGRRDNFGPPGPGDVGRESSIPGLMDRSPFGPQGNLNRDKLGPGMKRDDFSSPVQGNMNRDKFGAPLGPAGMNIDKFGPSGRAAMGRENFEFENTNRNNFEGRSQFDRNLVSDRDTFGGRSFDNKFGPRERPDFREGRSSREEDFDYANEDYANDDFRDDQDFRDDDFSRPPITQKPWNDQGGRNDFNERLPNFNRRKDDFGQMPPNIRTNQDLGFRNDRMPPVKDNFGLRDDTGDRFEPPVCGRPQFNKGPMLQEPGRFENRGNMPPNRLGDRFPTRMGDPSTFRDERSLTFRDNFEQGNFRDEEDYPPPPPFFGPQGQRNMGHDDNMTGLHQRKNSFGNSLLDAPEPPRFNREPFEDRYEEEAFADQYNQDFESEVPPNEVEEIWKPVTLIDYDHKSLKAPEIDILVEPFRMYDYRHKPLRRIPFPDRPNWLSDAVRMIPEFDPPIVRPPLIERRLFDDRDRFEPSPRRDDRDRYDVSRDDRDRYNISRDDRDRYDISRGDERRRYERRGRELDFSPPPPKIDVRDRGYEDSWLSRRNRSRSPPKFERTLVGGERTDRERVDRLKNRSGERVDRDRGRDREVNDDEWEGRAEGWDGEDRRRGGVSDSRGGANDSRGGSKDWESKGDRKDRGRQNKADNWKNKGRDWEERERQWEEDDMDLDDTERSRERDTRYRNDRNIEREPFGNKSSGGIFPLTKPVEDKKYSNITPIEDIINAPGRFDRPPRIVIILRGPPGSGKTFLAKLIKDKEVENGGSAPRILSLDDYFMVEQEKEIMEDGKRVKVKDMIYEFEAEMEESYRTSLMRSFKKTITDGYFPFIIVDNVNDKVKYFGEMWSFAKQNGFQVYICQLDLDIHNCTKRNIHNRTEEEIRKCVEGWENTPSHHPVLDASVLLQDDPIPVVEMEEINSPGSGVLENDDGLEDHLDRSKWDNFDCSVNNLARLDGVNKPLRPSRTMEEYLQLDEWQPIKPSKPGQKRVRWADLEERKQQEKMRAIGFVVGQTDWDRMMDPTKGESALTQTKYIEKAARRRF